MEELILHMNSDKPVGKSSSMSETMTSSSSNGGLNATTGITLTVKNENSQQLNTSNGDSLPNKSSHQNGKSEKENKTGDRDRSGGKDRDRDRERGGANAKSVREWDIPKLNQREHQKDAHHKSETASARSRSRSLSREKERQRKEASGKKSTTAAAAADQKPPKTLDDLFRKTQTTPFVYWLPLTEEQYQERQTAEQKRVEDRLRRAEERKLKEQTSIANTSVDASSIPNTINGQSVKTESKSEPILKGAERDAQDTSLDASKEDLEKSVEAKPVKVDTAQSRDRDRDRDRLG
jgi:hypothetical protein